LEEVARVLEDRFGERLLERATFRGELTYRVAPVDWFEVLAFCRDDSRLAFDQLDCLLGDHLPERPEAPLQAVAHLTSHVTGLRLRVKTALTEGQALGSVTALWPSGGFDEREAYEMLGIEFAGHPDLRRHGRGGRHGGGDGRGVGAAAARAACRRRAVRASPAGRPPRSRARGGSAGVIHAFPFSCTQNQTKAPCRRLLSPRG